MVPDTKKSVKSLFEEYMKCQAVQAAFKGVFEKLYYDGYFDFEPLMLPENGNGSNGAEEELPKALASGAETEELAGFLSATQYKAKDHLDKLNKIKPEGYAETESWEPGEADQQVLVKFVFRAVQKQARSNRTTMVEAFADYWQDFLKKANYPSEPKPTNPFTEKCKCFFGDSGNGQSKYYIVKGAHVNIVEIGSVPEFLDKIKIINNPNNDGKTEKRKKDLYYRGHASLNYKLIPFVSRDKNVLYAEKVMYDELRAESAEDFTGDGSIIDAIVRMQHYDLPTRLIDVTTNPLVALFFTLRQERNDHLNGEVMVFQFGQEDKGYAGSREVSILSAFSQISYYKQGLLLGKARLNEEDYGPWVELPQEKSINAEASSEESELGVEVSQSTEVNPEDKARDEAITEFLNAVSSDVHYRAERVARKEILRECLLIPKKTNPRLQRQQGAFFLQADVAYPGFNLSGRRVRMEDGSNGGRAEGITVFLINKNKKSKIRSELDSFAIREATMFPEITKLAEEIGRNARAKKYVSKGDETIYTRYGYTKAEVARGTMRTQRNEGKTGTTIHLPQKEFSKIIDTIQTWGRSDSDSVKRSKALENLYASLRNAKEKGKLSFGPYMWRVLRREDDKLLLLTDRIIDRRPFCEREEADRLYEEKKKVIWKDSTIRTWLNGEFLNRFESEERELIREELIYTAVYGERQRSKTDDYVFLLDKTEVKNTDYFATEKDRIAFYGNGKAGWWWLRSPGRSSYCAASVSYVGDVYVYGLGVIREGGVRPALWIKIPES